jgi:anti-sigma factor RsiW
VSEACDARRGDLAAAALGRLDPDALAEIEAHARACEACRNELARLRSVAALLDEVDPLTDVGEGAPPELASRVLQRVSAERHRARVRRRAAWCAAAAAAVVVAVAGVLIAAADDAGDDREGELAGLEVDFVDAPEGVEASATIAADGEGTVVELDASGLDPSTVYALWLSSSSGDRMPAGTFKPKTDGAVAVRLECAIDVDDAERIWATTPDGDVPLDAWFDG